MSDADNAKQNKQYIELRNRTVPLRTVESDLQAHIVENAWPTVRRRAVSASEAISLAFAEGESEEDDKLSDLIAELPETLGKLRISSEMSKGGTVYGGETDAEQVFEMQRRQLKDAIAELEEGQERLAEEKHAFLKGMEEYERKKKEERQGLSGASAPPSDSFVDLEAVKARLERISDCGTTSKTDDVVRKLGFKGISDSLIAPKHFTGRSGEDAEAWIEVFERYAEHKGFGPEEKRTLLPLLLREGASDWLSTLSKDAFQSYPTLRQAFADNYFGLRELKWKEAGNLWGQAQRCDETVDQFVTRIRKGAKRIQLAPEDLCNIVLHGLRPSFRIHVLQAGVLTLEGILKAAKLAEAVMPAQVTEASTAALMEVMRATVAAGEKQASELKQLTSRVAALTVQREEQEVCIATSNGQERGPRVYKQTPQRQQKVNYARNTGNRTAEGGARDQQHQQAGNTSCTRCARVHPRGACGADGVQCRLCGRPNHFARCCRSATARTQ